MATSSTVWRLRISEQILDFQEQKTFTELENREFLIFGNGSEISESSQVAWNVSRLNSVTIIKDRLRISRLNRFSRFLKLLLSKEIVWISEQKKHNNNA